MLIPSPRHSPADLSQWEMDAKRDAVVAGSSRLAKLSEKAIETVQQFAGGGDAYLSCSWGKDSVVALHLAYTAGLQWQIVYLAGDWAPGDGVANPDCEGVARTFLECHDMPYEVARLPGGRLQDLWRHYGERHVTGVRAQESVVRSISAARHGTTTNCVCRPILRWTAADVFGYLHRHNLPVHPAYAMTMGGAYDRDRLRVHSLGAHEGEGHGRRQWEMRYYPAECDGLVRRR